MYHLTAYVYVYNNSKICNTNEVTTFISNNTKNFMVNKVITLMQLLELVHQKKTLNHTNISKNSAFDAPYLSQDNRICTHVLFWEMMLTFDKCSTFFTTTQHYHSWSYLPQFVTTITHQTTNMTQPPMLTTCYMNTRVVGSKTMIVIVTPRAG